MLDENKEYYQYTYNIFDEKEKVLRLKYETLICKDCAGMPRALLIIARHYLHNVKDIYHCEGIHKENILNECIDLLRIWLGFDKDSSDKFPEIKSWLPNYINKSFLEPKIKECQKSDSTIEQLLEQIKNNLSSNENISKIEQIVHEKKNNHLVQLLKILNVYVSLQNKRGYMGQGIYASRYQGGLNKNKLTKLSDIVAEAYNAGKLKTRYLIFNDSIKKQPFDYIYKEKGDEYKKLKVTSQQDFILKVMAAYLIACEQRRDNMTVEIPISYVPINKQDMINWLSATKFPEIKNKKTEKDIFFFSENACDFEPLFKIKTNINGVKFSFCSAWINKFYVSEYKPTEKGRIFFEDAGASKYLIKHVVE